MAAKKPPTIPLPKSWTKHVRTAMLHVVSLAQYATAYTRSWAVNCQVARVRLKAENDRLRQHVTLLTEELRIKQQRLMMDTLAQRLLGGADLKILDRALEWSWGTRRPDSP